MSDDQTKTIEEKSLQEVAHFWHMRSRGYQSAAEILLARLAEAVAVGSQAVAALKAVDERVGVNPDQKTTELVDNMLTEMEKAFPAMQKLATREEKLEFVSKVAGGSFL